MDAKDFKESIRQMNIEYKKIFDTIPCIENYSCTQQEFVAAMKKSLQTRRSVSNFLKEYTD